MQQRAIIAFRLHKLLYAKLPDQFPLAIGGVARETNNPLFSKSVALFNIKSII